MTRAHALLCLSLGLSVGCGAKTGLRVDEAEDPRDAGADAGVDAGRRDAGPPPPPTVLACLGTVLHAVELPALGRGNGEWSVTVLNPGAEPARATFEAVEDGAVVTLGSRTIPPGGSTTLRRASRVALDESDLDCGRLGTGCPDGQRCECMGDACVCAGPRETPVAQRRRALRIRADRPVAAVQQNPADPVGSASSDASQLLSRAAWGRRYTVIGWPQTLSAPRFPPNFGATLTIVSDSPGTVVRITLGPNFGSQISDRFGDLRPGQTLEVVMDELEVLDLYTQEHLADFNGTIVEADQPVSVFSGSEASDAPVWERLDDRACCADHLETQLLPDAHLASSYWVPAFPNRVDAINDAAGRPVAAPVPDPVILELLAIEPGGATVTTSSPSDPVVRLEPGQPVLLEVEGGITLDGDAPFAVLVVMRGQETVLPTSNELPGGDPSIALVHPRGPAGDQLVFAPDGYPLDHLVMTAPTGAAPQLDGQLASRICDVRVAGPVTHYVCALSIPEILVGGGGFVVRPGTQRDGVHRISSPSEVSAFMVGVDSFGSHINPSCGLPGL